MAVKIKLKRQGKIRQPYYRIVVADSRTARDGRAIEEIGLYRPKEDPSFMQVDAERVAYWLSVGAQPTEAVTAILKVTGDWQKFKGLPGAEGTLRVAEAKADKQLVFEAAVKSAEQSGKAPKVKAPKPEAAAAVEAPVEAAAEPVAAEPVAAESVEVAQPVEATPAEAPAVEEPAAEAAEETPSE